MSQVTPLLEEMKGRFNADEAADMDNTFQYDIEDEGSWLITIADGKCEVAEGGSDEADVTLAMSLETFQGVMSGDIDGMEAFMSGDLQASGDIMLAPRLTDLFPQA